MGSATKSVLVEAHNSIGKVERYHGPVRRAYQIIRTELPDLDQNLALQMAFKAINNTAGPDGIVPTLLVFGAYLRLVKQDALSPTISQRIRALHKATEEVQKLRAKRQINDAINQQNGPSTTAIKDLPLNSQVFVWRKVPGANKTGKWTGPYLLLAVNNEDCIVELPSGPTAFRLISIKPYYQDDFFLIEPENPQNSEPEEPAPSQQLPVRRGRGRPRKTPLKEPFQVPLVR